MGVGTFDGNLARNSGPILNSAALYTRKEVYFIVIFAFLGALFDGVELNLLSYPLVYISESLHVTTKDIIQILTFQGLASLLGGFLFGWLGDIIGRRWSYALCVLVYGLGTFMAGFNDTYDSLFWTRIFAGLGIGGMFGLVFTMFTECWKTEKRGFMGGLIQSMFVVGQIITIGVTYFTIASFGHDMGWRSSFFILGGFSILIAILSLFLLPESKPWQMYRKKLKDGTLPKDLRRTAVPFVDLFKNKLAVGTILLMIISTGVFVVSYSVISFQSTFLLSEAKVPLNQASVILLLGLVCTGIAYVLTGYISDILNRKKAFFLGSVLGFIGFAFFMVLALTGNVTIGDNFWTAPIFWALMLCNAGYCSFAVMGIWMSEFYPTRIRATGSNVCYYVGRGLGAGAYPLFALQIAGSVTMALAFGLFGAIAALAFTLFTPDRTGREIQAIE
jgi:MFS family permease